MKKTLLAITAAAAMVCGCSHESDYDAAQAERQAKVNAEEALGFAIPETQDWNLTTSGNLEVTLDAGIGANEVLILDKFPFGATDVHALARLSAEEGQTVSVAYSAPSYLDHVYVACRNAQGDMRVRRLELDATTASFTEGPAAARTRATVAQPSVTEQGYSFNAQIAMAYTRFWQNVTDDATKEAATTEMNATWAWGNSGWEDKVYKINATVTTAQMTADEAANLYQALQDVIPHDQNNLSKAVATGYTIQPERGKTVTLTPLGNFSNSVDELYYYFYPKGQKPTAEQIKKMPKYNVGKMPGGYTYSLVYVDPQTGAVSYNWPTDKDYEVAFACTNTSWVENDAAKLKIYSGGGQTTTTTVTHEATGSLVKSGDALYSFKMSEGQAFALGAYPDGYNQYSTLGVRFGRTDWYGDWQGPNPYSDFKAAKANNSIAGFTAFTEGNGVNGTAKDPFKCGTTSYYLHFGEFWEATPLNYMMSVGVACQNKNVYVYDMGENIEATAGTLLDGFPVKSADKYWRLEFPVQMKHNYLILGDGSRLGFYGVEVYQNVGSVSSTTETTSVTSDVEYTYIPWHPEYYADGTLNESVHQISSSVHQSWAVWGDQKTNSHNAVFNMNGYVYLGFEDYSDFDFNDLLFQIEGAKAPDAPEVKVPEETKEGEKTITNQVYSYAFEDNTVEGDYDMNDVVLQVKQNEQDNDYIDVSLVAAGATYNIVVYLGESTALFEGKEIHSVLGVASSQMVNTELKTVTPKKCTVRKPEGFDFAKADFRLHVLSLRGRNEWVHVAETGQYPCGIMIPAEWKWPKERVSIIRAYPKFQSWATDDQLTRDSDWYLNPDEAEVIK